MKESSFHFSKPSLLSLIFNVNEDISTENNSQVSMSNTFNVRIAKNQDNKNAYVALEITIDIDKDNSSKDALSPFSLYAKMGALYSWDDDLDETSIDSLLSINAPSLLLSYARPIIASTVGSSFIPPYNLPFINFKE